MTSASSMASDISNEQPLLKNASTVEMAYSTSTMLKQSDDNYNWRRAGSLSPSGSWEQRLFNEINSEYYDPRIEVCPTSDFDTVVEQQKHQDDFEKGSTRVHC